MEYDPQLLISLANAELVNRYNNDAQGELLAALTAECKRQRLLAELALKEVQEGVYDFSDVDADDTTPAGAVREG